MRQPHSIRFLIFTLAGVLGLVPPPLRGDVFVNAGRGPILVQVPPSYDPEVPAPVVVLLHGYGSSGATKEAEYQITPLADELGFLYLYPDGTTDFLGSRFWNATDACCNFFGSGVDDVAYLTALLDEIDSVLSVDPRRVFFVGHSNGGFMAYRMACERSSRIAAIASLAGATFLNAAACAPSDPVHVLQVHGTADSVIQYNGGCLIGCYPGAAESVNQWVGFNGCSPVGDPTLPPLDLDAGIPGAETQVIRYAVDCRPGGSAELWSIQGGAHSPNITNNFSRLIVEFLLGHPAPPLGLPGDANCDGVIDSGDIPAFVLALTDPVGYAVSFPGCRFADANSDMLVNGEDITTFIELVVAP